MERSVYSNHVAHKGDFPGIVEATTAAAESDRGEEEEEEEQLDEEMPAEGEGGGDGGEEDDDPDPDAVAVPPRRIEFINTSFSAITTAVSTLSDDPSQSSAVSRFENHDPEILGYKKRGRCNYKGPNDKKQCNMFTQVSCIQCTRKSKKLRVYYCHDGMGKRGVARTCWSDHVRQCNGVSGY